MQLVETFALCSYALTKKGGILPSLLKLYFFPFNISLDNYSCNFSTFSFLGFATGGREGHKLTKLVFGKQKHVILNHTPELFCADQ